MIGTRTYTERERRIIDIVEENGKCSISEILELLEFDISQVTLNRDLAGLVESGVLTRKGKARSVRYLISDDYRLFSPVSIERYFQSEPDARGAKENFEFGIFDLLGSSILFTQEENDLLDSLKSEYQTNLKEISPTLYRKELERLTIELSWKSSQIEGNTYSLLETEKLFLEKEESKNRTKEEAIMLLNHKEAMELLIEQGGLGGELTVSRIESLHSILIKGLGVGKNVRRSGVGITGTSYRPLDNEFQIREALEKMCSLISSKKSGYEKALLAVALISYIQPFEDGNKRTGRILGNALLLADNCCPLSYRSVDSIEYKKAVILFYEQNNLLPFKQLFLEQSEFGVKNYFN